MCLAPSTSGPLCIMSPLVRVVDLFFLFAQLIPIHPSNLSRHVLKESLCGLWDKIFFNNNFQQHHVCLSYIIQPAVSVPVSVQWFVINFSPWHSDGPGDADYVFLSSTDSPGPGQSAWHIVGLSKQVFNVFTLFKPSGKSLQLKSIPIP